MDYVKLGRTGLKVSPLCLGCMTYGVPERGAHPWSLDEITNRMETDEFGKTLYAGTESSDRKVVERVAEVAVKRGVPRAQVALAWLAQKPFITAPIVGASKPQHLVDAVAALTLNLSPEEIASLEEPYVPHAVVGFT